MINITGWGAFWLACGAIGVTSIAAEALLKSANVRRILKFLEKMAELDATEGESDLVRNLLDQIK